VPVLIERGSFRPITRVGFDMLEQSLEKMRGEPDMKDREPVVLMEMTLRNLQSMGAQAEHEDFLARMDSLRALGKTVMISNYSRFHNVITYLRRYTQERIGMVLGIPTLAQILEDKHYEDLGGGVLEALGRLLSGPVKLYVYPWKNADSGETVTADTFRVPAHVTHLYAHLLANGFVESIPGAAAAVMPHEVLERMQRGDPSWESLVPDVVARVIKERKLFGYGEQAAKAGHGSKAAPVSGSTTSRS
jgi:hypothetical protein